MTYKEFKNESYNLYTIKTNRFKSCYMEIVFYKELDEKKITIENVLCDMLAYSSLKYPKRKNVVEQLEDLYSASFYGVSSHVGNLRTISFSYSFMDPIYADKKYLKEVIKFPFEMLFNPNIVNDEFDSKTLKIIKNRNLADIESIKEVPPRYAIKRALQQLDNQMPASYQYVGNIDDLNKINESNLVTEYKKLFTDYKCDIFIIGNLDMENINMLINEYYLNNIIIKDKYDIYYKNKVHNKLIDVEEKMDVKQASLVCIYELNNLTKDECNYGFIIFNKIFGNGSLTNKLYQNLREKNSLCYNVSSLHQKYDNLLIVYTGIDPKNKNKAVKLIKKSLNEMIKGDFLDSEIKNAKDSFKNSLKSTLNSPRALIDNYFFHVIAGVDLVEDRETNIDKVTKKDVISIASKMKLSCIYLLSGGEK